MVSSLPDGARKSKAQAIPILLADSSDQASLDAVVSSTKVILTTVGPFLKYGKPLVDACVRFGTDYVDSTGETTFIRDLIDSYHQTAVEKKIRIVPSCGFDSLPSDVMAFLLADHFNKLGKDTVAVRAAVLDARGGVSGGTLSTVANFVSSIPLSQITKGSDPWILVTNDEPASRPATESPAVLAFNKDLQRYETPWVMGAGNTAYVRRSYALFERMYGNSFRYNESFGMFSNFWSALIGGVAANAVLALILLFPPTRWLVTKLVPPGSNTATEGELRNGHATLKAVGVATDGAKAIVTFKAAVDLGYVGTGIMLAESALCLALDDKILQSGGRDNVGSFGVKEGGVLTSVTAMGLAIVRRLKQVGYEIDVKSI
ncbi:hypothetical protein BDR26DRAFT_869369 [Obelidium mucronatum]|nr:hypothetical protein BDR26DRAFT_869369 [Obelidium mucronatum]